MKPMSGAAAMAQRFGAVAALILAPVARAADEAAAAATTAAGGGSDPLGAMLLRTSLGLAVVLVLIFALAWLARRWGGPTRAGGRVPMQVVGSLILAPRERILVVEIEERWLVIGVGPGGMRTLQELPARPLNDADTRHGLRGQGASGESTFLGRLQAAMQRRPS